MPRALIALGTNLGDRSAILARAIERLRGLAAAGAIRVSSPLETAPAGGPPGQQPFLNAAAVLETALAPAELLAGLRAIESELGRVRTERWGPRPIDLDMLLYDDAPGRSRVLATDELSIPHPRMAFRRFVLQPAAEVAGEMRHPIFGRTVEQLWAHLNDSPRLVVLLGETAALRNAVAQAIATRTGAACILDPAPDDSSGRSSAGPLQFLQHAAQQLAEHDWNSPQWVISALSLQQRMAEVATMPGETLPGKRLSVASWTAGDESLDASLEPLAKPRLLVLLDDWSELVALHLGDRPRPGNSLRQTSLYVASISEMPVLCAGHRDFESQLTEITAALVAME